MSRVHKPCLSDHQLQKKPHYSCTYVLQVHVLGQLLQVLCMQRWW